MQRILAKENILHQAGSCYANCREPDCGEEKAVNFGYKPADGNRFEVCGSQYLLSKSTSFTQQSGQTFCCTKHMSVGSIETPEEANCFARALIKRNQSGINFWTSATPSNCTGTYVWCSLDGSGEVVDQESLPRPQNAKSSGKFVMVQANAKTELLSFEFGEPSAKSRVICEREQPQNCRESLCHPVGFAVEKRDIQGIKNTVFYRRNCKYLYGCQRVFDVCPEPSYNYYQGLKWCRVNFEEAFMALTLESTEKLKCVLEVFKANGIKDTTFFIGATSFGCPKSIRWCEHKDKPFLNTSLYRWDDGEPSMDPAKDCVYAKYNASKGEITLGKMLCTISTLPVLISQSETTYQKYSFGLKN
ncbi:uncharacterized protein LOC135939694 [Cloeon dipterum]|uniref:uncharacterized protein LOC135939694 n=1 Tax=Cloeon dipterum TaxID=197152 RepID=UPI00321F7D34